MNKDTFIKILDLLIAFVLGCLLTSIIASPARRPAPAELRVTVLVTNCPGPAPDFRLLNTIPWTWNQGSIVTNNLNLIGQ